jgi:hypothetical protein
MKKILAKLSEKIELLESLGHFHEAEKIHQQFIKIANDEDLDDEDLDDEDLDDEEYVDDPERFTLPSNIFFNSETNQPIIHEGKMLAALNSSDEDMPELRGKVREMTGVENITVVRIPADIRKLIGVQTEADTRRLDKIHQGHVDEIEQYPDIVYMLLIGDNTLNYEEKDILFGSGEDAESVATLLRNYFESKGRDVDIKPVGISISIADSLEEGLSLPELYEKDKFIYLENSEIGMWDRPETSGDLDSLLFHSSMMNTMNVERLQELHSGTPEWELDNIYGDDDDDDGPKLSSMIKGLHKIANSLENDGLDVEAGIVTDIFIKLSKKKAKTKKNVPNNPSLWAECKAWAKRTFDVYPSAYSNGAASKRYKSKGGTWRKEK